MYQRRPMGTRLLKHFARHLTMRQTTTEQTVNDMELQPVGYTPAVDPSKIKRITRKRRYPEAEAYHCKLLNDQLQLRFEHLVAESEHMQTMCLAEDEEILPNFRDESLILVEDPSMNLVEHKVGQEVLELYAASELDKGQPLPLADNKSTLIMVHDEGQESQEGFSNCNIEVLLEAAEKRGICRDSIQQVVFCQPSSGNYLSGSSQILLMDGETLSENLDDDLDNMIIS